MVKAAVKKRKLTKKEEDLIFSKRTEDAYKRYEKGEFKTVSYEDFLEEIKKW